MGYGPSSLAQQRRSATCMRTFLTGSKPTDLPGEQPRGFECVSNRKTAQALGLTITQHVFIQATEVIQ